MLYAYKISVVCLSHCGLRPYIFCGVCGSHQFTAFSYLLHLHYHHAS